MARQETARQEIQEKYRKKKGGVRGDASLLSKEQQDTRRLEEEQLEIMKSLFFVFVGVAHLLSLNSGKAIYKNDISQRTFQEIKNEIASYEDVAKAIINLAVYGITAEVLVVTSFDELQRRASEARGKIIVYNQPYTSYGITVQYRHQGAVEAAKVGAVASLIRSVASFSIYSPHTGIQEYQDGVPKIPTACITVEDTEMMSRMASRGNKIVIHLEMGAKTYPDTESFNTVAEITGSKYPEQVVLISGHLDSWDVGQGALDDGGGAVISWEALSLVKDLGLRPKRTLRLVLWTAEEQGGIGASQYYELHKANVSNYSLVMESDSGTYLPTGLQFTGSDKARAIMKEIMSLLQPLNVTNVFSDGEGTDINFWIQAGVPGASLRDDLYKYFSFHHSHGDTMTAMDPKQMNVAAAVWAVVAYVVADMEEMLPRSRGEQEGRPL